MRPAAIPCASGSHPRAPHPTTLEMRAITTGTPVRACAARATSSPRHLERRYGVFGRIGDRSSTGGEVTKPWTPSVLPYTTRWIPASRAASITFAVPRTFTSCSRDRAPDFAAARWITCEQPLIATATDSTSRTSPRTTSMPAASSECTSAEARASARTSCPSRARRRATPPPMNPVAPVTSTRIAVLSPPGRACPPDARAARDGACGAARSPPCVPPRRPRR